MAMLLLGSGEDQQQKVVKILKLVSALVEILGQFDKEQAEIEITADVAKATKTKTTNKKQFMKPMEMEVNKLTQLLEADGKNANDWPEIRLIREYLHQPQA